MERRYRIQGETERAVDDSRFRLKNVMTASCFTSHTLRTTSPLVSAKNTLSGKLSVTVRYFLGAVYRLTESSPQSMGASSKTQ